MKGSVKSINVSDEKSVKKRAVGRTFVKKDFGIEGDAHASGGNRQVSLLSWERIQEQGMGLKPGDFAENITTEGIDLTRVGVGNLIKTGDVVMRVSQIGKECHSRCEIYNNIGDCIMPREGIFAKVLEGGEIRVGDKIEVISED